MTGRKGTSYRHTQDAKDRIAASTKRRWDRLRELEEAEANRNMEEA
jgi:hypothetical protein